VGKINNITVSIQTWREFLGLPNSLNLVYSMDFQNFLDFLRTPRDLGLGKLFEFLRFHKSPRTTQSSDLANSMNFRNCSDFTNFLTPWTSRNPHTLHLTKFLNSSIKTSNCKTFELVGLLRAQASQAF
jgi:hypothetical protein